MFRFWITRDLVTKGKEVVSSYNVHLNDVQPYIDNYNHGTEVVPVISMTNFKELLDIAREANTYQKERFHTDVCLQSRGCHCSPTELDKFLARNANSIKEIDEEYE